MEDYALQIFLKGAIDNAKERVRRNYKTAIPQYYRGKIQLLLPLCLGNPQPISTLKFCQFWKTTCKEVVAT